MAKVVNELWDGTTFVPLSEVDRWRKTRTIRRSKRKLSKFVLMAYSAAAENKEQVE